MKPRMPRPGKHRMILRPRTTKLPACACCGTKGEELRQCESCDHNVCYECSGSTDHDMDGDAVGELTCRTCAHKNLEDAATWENLDEGDLMSHIEEFHLAYQATC